MPRRHSLTERLECYLSESQGGTGNISCRPLTDVNIILQLASEECDGVGTMCTGSSMQGAREGIHGRNPAHGLALHHSSGPGQISLTPLP